IISEMPLMARWNSLLTLIAIVIPVALSQQLIYTTYLVARSY
ncbi:unnamed protein product, partial [marine sediment metagenome]